MKATRLGRCIVFGDFELYPESGQLLKFGYRITRARPQEVRLLTLLIEHAGQKVSKDEIHARLWPGEIPSKNRLNVVLSNARAALGDTDPEQRKFIASLGEDGYCFVHPIRRVLRSSGGCEDREAEEAYRAGRHAMDNRQESSLERAAAFFKQAIDRNPSFTSAWIGLADAQIMRGIFCIEPPAESFAKARAAAKHAVSIEGPIPEAVASLAWLKLCHDRNFRAAELGFAQTLRRNPGYAFAHNGMALLRLVTGRVEDTLSSLEKARKLSPLSPPLQALYCHSLYYARRYPESVEAGLKAVANDPKSPIAHSALGFALLAAGEYGAAVSRNAEGRSLSNDSKVYVGFWGYACGRAGMRAEAESALNDLLSRRDYVPSYFVGLIHLSLGRHEDAIKWLDRAREEHSHWVLFLRADPMFDDLRCYSAFETLLQKIGFHQTYGAVAGGGSQSTRSGMDASV